MKAFKLYFKIARNNLTSMLAYLLPFTLIFLLIIGQMDIDSPGLIQVHKPRLYVEDQDDTLLSRDFMNYLQSESKPPLSDVSPEPEAIEKAIYTSLIDYAVVIPSGFGQYLLDPDKSVTIPVTTYVNKQSAMPQAIDMLISNYVSNWQVTQAIYQQYILQGNLAPAFEHLDTVLKQEVELRTIGGKETGPTIAMSYFLASLNYIVVALSFLMVGQTVIAMEEPLMKRRDVVSGYSETTRTTEIFQASYLLMTVVWVIMVIAALAILGWNLINTTSTVYKLVSNYLHLLAISSLGLFICHLLPERNAIRFMSTLFSLLIAFASGIFIPAEFLWQPFHKFSMIFPTYWDVQNQHSIDALLTAGNSLAPYYKNLAIIAGMGILAFLLTLLTRYFKAQSIEDVDILPKSKQN